MLEAPTEDGAGSEQVWGSRDLATNLGLERKAAQPHGGCTPEATTSPLALLTFLNFTPFSPCPSSYTPQSLSSSHSLGFSGEESGA